MPRQTAVTPDPKGRNLHERQAINQLQGAVIHSAELMEDGALCLVLRTPGSAAFSVAIVARDPEGNGPGSLHYFMNGTGHGWPVGGR